MIRLRLRAKPAGQISGQCEVIVTPAPPAPATRLLLLAPEAAGPALRRVHTFPDAACAVDFIRFWFPPCHRRGLTACWTLPPWANDARAEALVLVRCEDGSIAYPFSFADMPSALAFLRAEAARGLDLSRVLLLGALPVTITSLPGGDVCIDPSLPPVTERPVPVSRPPADEPKPAIAASAAARGPVRVREEFRMPRWPQRAEAFQGFGSPPGRF